MSMHHLPARILIPLWLAVCSLHGATAPAQLRCDGRVDPMGIDTTPHLGWILQADADARGVTQRAYRILVASSPGILARNQGDLWDSGEISSDAMDHIPYGGQALGSSDAAYWKVRIWDGTGTPSPWSPAATWTMGVLKPGDWSGMWITARGAEAAQRRSQAYQAKPVRDAAAVKWVQVDLGRPLPIDRIRLEPATHQGRDGFGFPRRFRIEGGSDTACSTTVLLADRTTQDVPDPGATPLDLPGGGVTTRVVRITATALAPLNRRDFGFALRRLRVWSAGAEVAMDAPVQAADSMEGDGWGMDGLVRPDEKDQTTHHPDPEASLRFRREFPVLPGLRHAVIHVSGLGQYELAINGAKVGDLLAPGWTAYDRTVLYDTFDITACLHPGANAAGITLGNGMYTIAPDLERYVKFTRSGGPQQAIACISLEYADGTRKRIGTDASWLAGPSPITYSNVYGGEDRDGRLEERGWSSPGFHPDGDWSPAQAAKGPSGVLAGLSCAGLPIRAIETLQPRTATALGSGRFLYDLGQNASLMPRLSVTGPAGATVRIIPSELLKADGTVDRTSCTQDGVRPAWWSYTLAGDGVETWFPSFFYQGARYLQVEIRPATPGGPLPIIESLSGVVVHAAAAPIGSFSCSNPLFNRIYTLVR